MQARTFLCTRCGKVRRREHASTLRPGQPEWPRCCDHEMHLLSHEQAAASSRLSPVQRLEWLALGAHVVRARSRGVRKWRAADSLRKVALAAEQLETLSRQQRRGNPLRRNVVTPKSEPRAKAWDVARHRQAHVVKKGRRSG